MRITVLEVSKWRNGRRRSLRGSKAPRIVSVRDAVRELKPRVPYTQKKEKKSAGRWRRRGTGKSEEGKRQNGKKKDEKRSERGKERRGPYIARSLAEPEIDLGKNPPVASSLSHLLLHHFPRFLRRWSLLANPRLCFCFRKKGPSPSARL